MIKLLAKVLVALCVMGSASTSCGGLILEPIANGAVVVSFESEFMRMKNYQIAVCEDRTGKVARCKIFDLKPYATFVGQNNCLRGERLCVYQFMRYLHNHGIRGMEDLLYNSFETTIFLGRAYPDFQWILIETDSSIKEISRVPQPTNRLILINKPQ